MIWLRKIIANSFLLNVTPHFKGENCSVGNIKTSSNETTRTFRTRMNNHNSELLNGSDKTDKWKVAFVEGYSEGRAVTVCRPILWKVISALVAGIFIGIGLPYTIFKSQSGTRNIYVDSKHITTTFADVKGIEEAKQELQDVVQYLKRPEIFSRLGGKTPKGVLLTGPPGTGKTLLARALAGEAGVPYFQVSGSEFEQTFVGEGAKRVRDLFHVAKNNAPCVIFIDEIDAVGSKRIHSPLHPHAHQTINQLLTEMDGFHRNEGIIVVAATNRRQDLDTALLRPGRFDVEVLVPMPTYAERKQIIQHYLDNIVTNITSTDEIAQTTIGFTGAHLETMINRSALRAASEGGLRVTSEHVLAERDRILMGTELKNRIPDETSKKITAYHEAGHCIVSIFTPNSQPVHKVSIVPRGESLGHTAYIPDADRVYITKAQLLARIDALLAGRAAEELVFGPEQVTSGAENDFKAATELATNMVSKWGMSEIIGLRNEQGMEKKGPAYQDIVDSEVRNILKESYERSKNLLSKYSAEHVRLSEALLKHEKLEAKDVFTILTNT